MKRKISIILSLLSVFILCITLAACNGNKDDKTIKNLSGDCGFTAEGEFAEGSTLVVEPLRGATDEQKAMIAAKDICVNYNMQVYDISVQKDNAKVQPNGKVKITLDFNGDSANGYSVFHFKSDTEMEVLSATLANGKLSFETSSFSVFIIGENKPEEYNYNITYNLDGGAFADGVTAPASYSNESEFPLVLPAPVKSGYDFKGWKNAYGVEMTEISAKMRGDLTLTAQWEKSAEPAYIMSEDGKTVMFGSYPQTLVDDETLSAKLTENVGSMSVISEDDGWTSFGFYSENTVRDYAWYKDIEFEGNRYRGVYFIEYRMRRTDMASSATLGLIDSYVRQNGVELNKIYWFKFEPIKWRVLTKTDGKAFLMCDNAIFAMQFQHNTNSGIPCDYANSDIRAWLNGSFFKEAFGIMQKDIILDTVVDNSLRSANPKENENWNVGAYGTAGENTVDKIFLLSAYDVTNSDYGFNANPEAYSDRSEKMGRSLCWTDYGIYLGGLKYDGGVYPSSDCDWLLRSPVFMSKGSGEKLYNCQVLAGGTSGDIKKYRVTDNTEYGIVPALWINL